MAPGTPLDKARERSIAEARAALLRARGITLKALAKRLGVDRSLISHVNAGRKRSRRVEQAIARELGLALRDAFPEHEEAA
jgi:transcriptional regulator with XRE-family HTH domain